MHIGVHHMSDLAVSHFQDITTFIILIIFFFFQFFLSHFQQLTPKNLLGVFAQVKIGLKKILSREEFFL